MMVYHAAVLWLRIKGSSTSQATKSMSWLIPIIV